jgi:GntR family transcriptional regulator
VTGPYLWVITVITMEIDREGPEPPYRQLAAYLRGQIQSGEIPPDRPVPSKKTLQQRFGVAGNTIDKAIQLLKDEGLVHTIKGMGIYVTRPQDRR